MPLSRKTILQARYKQFSKFGFDDSESMTLAKSGYKFTNALLKQRILRRNKMVGAILDANKTLSLGEAIRQAVLEDPLLEPVTEKGPEPKSGIMGLLRRLM